MSVNIKFFNPSRDEVRSKNLGILTIKKYVFPWLIIFLYT